LGVTGEHRHSPPFHHQFLEKLSFLHWVAFVPLSKVNWLYLCGPIPGISSQFYCFMCHSFVNNILSGLLKHFCLWGLNSGPHICLAGTLPLEPLH
jgi:hypothetical protein